MLALAREFATTLANALGPPPDPARLCVASGAGLRAATVCRREIAPLSIKASRPALGAGSGAGKGDSGFR